MLPEFLINLLGAPGVVLVILWLAREVRAMRVAVAGLVPRVERVEKRLRIVHEEEEHARGHA